MPASSPSILYHSDLNTRGGQIGGQGVGGEEAMAPRLIGLPNEIIHNILRYVEPDDLGRVPRVCGMLEKFVRGDGQLWRDVWGEWMDVPGGDRLVEFDFKREVQKNVEAETVILKRGQSVDEKIDFIPLISHAVQTLAQNASRLDSRNLEILQEWFSLSRSNSRNIEAFLCQSTTYTRSKLPTDTHPLPSLEIRQATAKLHVLHGVFVRTLRRSKYAYSYPFAASMVYDLRNYREETRWGPYLPSISNRNIGRGEDGELISGVEGEVGGGDVKVDWEKLEAIMIVLGHNMRMFEDERHEIDRPNWNVPFWGTGRDSFVNPVESAVRKEMEEGKGKGKGKQVADDENEENEEGPGFEDPYNITGTWMRIVTFLDFHELFSYNFIRGIPPPNQPREPINTSEAVRMIVMVLKATRREDPGPEDGQELPIVYFEGTARALNNLDPNSNSFIRGRVGMTKEGECRWESWSIYGSSDGIGQARWKSDGIQVGGPNSGRGVLGHWFDKDFSQHGPAGPTAYWKTSNTVNDTEQFERQLMQSSWGVGLDSDDEDIDAEQLENEDDDDEEEEGVEIVIGGGDGTGEGTGDDSLDGIFIRLGQAGDEGIIITEGQSTALRRFFGWSDEREEEEEVADAEGEVDEENGDGERPRPRQKILKAVFKNRVTEQGNGEGSSSGN